MGTPHTNTTRAMPFPSRVRTFPHTVAIKYTANNGTTSVNCSRVINAMPIANPETASQANEFAFWKRTSPANEINTSSAASGSVNAVFANHHAIVAKPKAIVVSSATRRPYPSHLPTQYNNVAVSAVTSGFSKATTPNRVQKPL